MALLMALIVGVAVGIAGGYLLQKSHELLLINIALGVMGAVLGDAVYFFASNNFTMLFTWAGLLSQILGALIFVLIFSFLRRAVSKTR